MFVLKTDPAQSILAEHHESKGAPKLTAPIPISDHLRSGVSSWDTLYNEKKRKNNIYMLYMYITYVCVYRYIYHRYIFFE